MSTINLKSLANKGKGKPATVAKAPEPEVEVEEPEVEETVEEDTSVDETVAAAVEAGENPFDTMDAKQIDALIKEHELPVPKNWKVMKLAAKRAWLTDNVDLSGDETEEATEEATAEEPEAVEEAETEEVVAAPVKKGKTATTAVAKPAKTGTIVEKSEISEMAAEIENLKEKDALALAVELVNSADRGFFKLGGVLSIIQENKWYAPYASFKEYIENEHSMDYRRALYWVTIYNSMVASDVPYSKVAHLGWTKLKEIAPILTLKNVNEWVKLAEKNNVATLAQLVKNNKAKQIEGDTANVDDKVQQTIVTKAFKVHPDQKDTIDAALQKAKEDSGTEVDTVALEFICTDFLNGGKKAGKPGKIPPLAKQLKDAGAEAAIEAFNEAFPDMQLSMAEEASE